MVMAKKLFNSARGDGTSVNFDLGSRVMARANGGAAATNRSIRLRSDGSNCGCHTPR